MDSVLSRPRSPRIVSVGSVTDRGSAVVVVIHFPPCGTANRCTAPLSFPLPLSCSPIAIMLPSAFTATADPNLLRAAPSDAVSWAAVDVAAHPVAGFVNTYAAPFTPAGPCCCRGQGHLLQGTGAAPSTLAAPPAPTTTVPPSPLIATSSPKSSVPTGFALVSFARPYDDDHAVPGLVNTYAPSVLPALVPATTVSPFSLTDTRHPKNSLAVRVVGVSSTALPVSAAAHPVFGFVNTCTAPELVTVLLASLSGDPMTTVFPSPLTDTASPNRSCLTRSAFAILNFAPLLNVPVPVHPPDGLVNTYAAPTFVTIAVASSNGAPTTIVLPSLLTDTAHPKRSPAAVSYPTTFLLGGVVPLLHPPDGFVNTYTAPALVPRPSLSWDAPTTIVL